MPRVRLANGALRDQIRQDLFDTLVQSVGSNFTGTNKFFTDIQGKGAHLTNLRQAQLLENQVSYLIQGLGYNAIVPTVGGTLVLPLLLNYSAYKLIIGEKIYWEGPLRYIAGNVQQEGGFLSQYGSYDNAKYALKGQDSVAIPPLQSFRVEVIVGGFPAAPVEAATEAVDYDIHHVARLMGLLRRPVQ